MELSELESRLRRLEDIEAIKQLKALYCKHCDDDYDADALAGLFTEDAVWDGGGTFGRADGREAIRRHFSGASKRVSIARHQVMNPIIEVGVDRSGHSDPDAATGHWLLFQPCSNAGPDGQTETGDTAMWLAATYADEYRRIADRWLISATLIDVAFFSSYDEGWVEQRFLPGREP